MLKFGECSKVLLQGSLLLGIVMLAPALGRADDFSWGGDSGCSDPPITTDVFTNLFSANSSGGLCLAFGNHSGGTFHSLEFTTTYPDANTSDALVCTPGPWFATCDFKVDGSSVPNNTVVTGSHSTLTVEFFDGGDHHGIPDAGSSTDNFFINLNNPGIACTRSPCPPPNDPSGTGDWTTGGVANSFSGSANGVPEPRSGALLLAALGVLAASIRMARKRC
jgi:hypothetical protein